MLDVYYKNETLFVDVTNDITIETITLLERRIFKIIDEYGVDKVIVSIFGNSNMELLNNFKRNFYHKYKGFLFVKWVIVNQIL